jgi:hypothetical protein
MKGNHMKQMKYLSIIATFVVAISILSAQTKPSNPSLPNNNPPRVPGNNPSLPNNNPPRVPGNNNPSLPGSTIAPAASPIGTPALSVPSPAASTTPASSPVVTPSPR